jgi:hypothetical protein
MKKSIYQKELDEIRGIQDEPESGKKKKRKKDKKDLGKVPEKKKNMLQRFNERNAKGNVQNTLLKVLADIAGVGIGTVLSAAAGRFAPAVGAALIGTGHYIGDQSGLLRVVGASTFAHSVSKAKSYRENPNQTLAERFGELKDEWLIATLLKHYEPIQKTTAIPNSEPAEVTQRELPEESQPNSIEGVAEKTSEESEEETELDISGLDQFERFNIDSADQYEQIRNSETELVEQSDDMESQQLNDGPPDYDSNALEDQIDFTDF